MFPCWFKGNRLHWTYFSFFPDLSKWRIAGSLNRSIGSFDWTAWGSGAFPLYPARSKQPEIRGALGLSHYPARSSRRSFRGPGSNLLGLKRVFFMKTPARKPDKRVADQLNTP